MPKLNELSQKQKNFCNLIVNGYTYTDAYFTAYNVKNKQTAMVEGSKLALKKEIQDYIKTLNKPIEEAAQIKAITDREKQIEYIKSRIAICEQKEDENSIIRYTDQLNKLLNLYKDNDQEQKTQSPLATMDNSTLEKLSKAL